MDRSRARAGKMSWQELLCPERIRPYQRRGSSDLRSEYEKDYHRIIGSASFRRLQDKTQVFPLDKSDFIRTRLTHSLEVSSFARSLGQSVGRSIVREGRDASFTPENQMDICDILQCAGLLHDIGNPPFGHFGETSIRSWFRDHLPVIRYRRSGVEYEAGGQMLPACGGNADDGGTVGEIGTPLSELLTPQMQGDFTNFEGNTQALRVVTKLHYLVDEHGMNLTKALLATIIKYPVSSVEIDRNGPIRTHKMGYYYADREVFDEIEASCGLGGARHPLCYLLEAGDDIAYLTADIEDAFKKGIISYERLVMELERYAREEDSEDLPPDRQSVYRQLVGRLKDKHRQALQRQMDAPEDYAVQNWIVSVQGRLLQEAGGSFMAHYDAIMQGDFDRELIEGTGGEHIADALRSIAAEFVFRSRPIVTIEISASRILSFLLDHFVRAVLYYDTDRRLTPIDERLVSLISGNYRTIYRKYSEGRSEEEKLYLRLLLVTDFVCGMTDSFAQDLYWKLNGRI